jgi:hypothetical protein
MTNSLDPREARLYRRRARLSQSLGLAAVPVSLAALINPAKLTTSSIAVGLSGPLDTIWTVAYLVGGLCAFVGVQWRPVPRPEIEAFGVWLLLGAMLINGLTIVAIRGPVGGGITALGLFALADVLYARTKDLEESRHVRRAPTGERSDMGRQSDRRARKL